MEPAYRGLGRCACCFWLAVAFDVLGLLVLLVGVFVNVFFYDLLIYAGAIVIFLSLIWWVFWYSGNVEVPPAELEDDVGLLKKKPGPLGELGGAVRRLSGRLSNGIRSSLRRNGAPTGGGRGARAAGASAGSAGAPVQRVSVVMTTVSPVADCEVEMPGTSLQTTAT